MSSTKAEKLGTIVGIDNTAEIDVLTTGGRRCVPVVRPANEPEALECLRACSLDRLSVLPAGAAKWIDCGNPARRLDVVLALNRMNRIVEYSPPDLTVEAEAGLTLRELNRRTQRERQWLPLDPPDLHSASTGGVAACNSSGLLRLGFGTVRDYVIGLRLAHADGTRSKCGGRVVKNVAGYDLSKLYIGSFGTLALITSLTFKLRPLPESSATMVISASPTYSWQHLTRAIRESALQPATLAITNIGLLSRDAPHTSLVLRFVDAEAAVANQIDRLRTLLPKDLSAQVLSGDEASRLETELGDFGSSAPFSVKSSVPASQSLNEFERWTSIADCVAVADVGLGIVRAAFYEPIDGRKTIEQERARVESVCGSLTVERAPDEVKLATDAWGKVTGGLELMRGIKDKFDPQAILNPGRFAGGI